MKNMIMEMLSSDGGISSKRVITFLSFLLLAIGFIANLFFKLTVEEFMYETMSYIVIAGLGFTASEYFSNRKSKVKGTKVEIESTVEETS